MQLAAARPAVRTSTPPLPRPSWRAPSSPGPSLLPPFLVAPFCPPTSPRPTALAEILDGQGRQPRLVAHREMHDRHPIGLGERLGQQYVRFRGFRIGLQEVAAVKHHRVDLAGRDELEYLDFAAALFGQRGDVV